MSLRRRQHVLTLLARRRSCRAIFGSSSAGISTVYLRTPAPLDQRRDALLKLRRLFPARYTVCRQTHQLLRVAKYPDRPASARLPLTTQPKSPRTSITYFDPWYSPVAILPRNNPLL